MILITYKIITKKMLKREIIDYLKNTYEKSNKVVRVAMVVGFILMFVAYMILMAIVEQQK